MTEIVKTNGHGPLPEAIERALVSGDLSALNTQERLAFYRSKCDAAGLDPRAQPFEYLKLSGKLVLYARKAATDQLIANRHLSVAIVSRGMDFECHCYVVTCRVTYPDGQTVEDLGAVPFGYSDDRGDLGILKGEAAANAMMKATTKAKRRTVLSACGLGMLDESEVESIPDAQVVPAATPGPSRIDGPRPVPMTYPREANPVYAEAKSKPRSEFRQFCDARITAVNDNWRNILALEKPPKDSLFKPLCNVSQLGNHLVKVWVAEGTLNETDLCTDGKRDRAKVGLTLTHRWETERAAIEQEVGRYLRGLVAEAAKAAGVAMPEPNDGDVWDEEFGSVPTAGDGA